MKTEFFVLFILAIFSLSMISGASAIDADHIYLPDHGATKFNVTLNEMFVIALSSNPSTGYQGVCDYDPHYIQLIGEYYVPNEDNISGSSGTQIYCFKALKTGATQIALEYKRPWKSLPAKNITCNITITD